MSFSKIENQITLFFKSGPDTQTALGWPVRLQLAGGKGKKTQHRPA
jgi:hypothetical protein